MPLDPAVARRRILIVAALALLVRLVFGVFYWVDKPLTHDEREYLALSQSIAAGNGFVYGPGHETGTAQQFGRAPAYPLFLAAIGAGAEDNTSSPSASRSRSHSSAQSASGSSATIAIRTAGPTRRDRGRGNRGVLSPACLDPRVRSERDAVQHRRARGRADAGRRARSRSEPERRAAAQRMVGCRAVSLTGIAILVRPAMLFFLPLALLWMARRRRARARRHRWS